MRAFLAYVFLAYAAIAAEPPFIAVRPSDVEDARLGSGGGDSVIITLTPAKMREVLHGQQIHATIRLDVPLHLDRADVGKVESGVIVVRLPDQKTAVRLINLLKHGDNRT
jgi:hypothetical protein